MLLVMQTLPSRIICFRRKPKSSHYVERVKTLTHKRFRSKNDVRKQCRENAKIERLHPLMSCKHRDITRDLPYLNVSAT